MSMATIRPKPSRRRVAAAGWIFIAFALLAAGVSAGAIAQPRAWAFAFPIAGFVLYVLAFRRGLSQIRDFDVLWREGARRRPRTPSEPAVQHPQKTARARVTRGEFARHVGARHPRSTPDPEAVR